MGLWSNSNHNSCMAEVLTISDLSEGIVNKSSVLEGIFLNRYGTYDGIVSSVKLSHAVKHYIINADLTDRKGLATVTVSCYGEAVCDMFKDVLVPGKTVRLSGFTIKVRTDGKEHGDIPRSVRLHIDSTANLIRDFGSPVVLKFCTSDKISTFINRSEDKVYLHPSLSITVFDVFPERENLLTVKIADGTSDDDIFVLEMGPDQKHLYDQLCDKIKNNSAPVLFLKNVLFNTFGRNHSFRIDKATIVTEVRGEKMKKHLELVFKTLCASRAVHREVTGILYVRNPAASAFRKLCSNCKLQNFINLEDARISCFSCNGTYNFIRIPRLECEIRVYDSSTISCFAVSEEVRAIINYDPEDFLDVDEFKKNEVLSHVELDGVFKINSVNQLCRVTPTYVFRSDIAGLLSPQHDKLRGAEQSSLARQCLRENTMEENTFNQFVSNGETAYEYVDGCETSYSDIEAERYGGSVQGNGTLRKLTIKGGKGKRKVSHVLD